jgi:hypothetical protein
LREQGAGVRGQLGEYFFKQLLMGLGPPVKDEKIGRAALPAVSSDSEFLFF